MPGAARRDRDWQPYALKCWPGCSTATQSAPLNQSLVRNSRVASEVGASYDVTRTRTGDVLSRRDASQGRSAAELEAGLRAELARLVQEGVTEEELARVKGAGGCEPGIQARFDFRPVDGNRPVRDGGLCPIGTSIAVLERVKAVSAEQVRAVAKQYFVDDQLTVVVLEPQPLAQARPAPRA